MTSEFSDELRAEYCRWIHLRRCECKSKHNREVMLFTLPDHLIDLARTVEDTLPVDEYNRVSLTAYER